MNLIAKKISEARKLMGLTQEEVAELAQVNLRTVQRIENGENFPRHKTLHLICNALQIEVDEVVGKKKEGVANKIANAFFLVVLNMILMGIIGFLTLDIYATVSSRFGGILLSIFLPYAIVTFSKNMSGMERMLKFGFGYMAYFVIVLIMLGFPKGFSTLLFPCLFISLTVLYFGNKLIDVFKLRP